jgi:hypothetical protein
MIAPFNYSVGIHRLLSIFQIALNCLDDGMDRALKGFATDYSEKAMENGLSQSLSAGGGDSA